MSNSHTNKTHLCIALILFFIPIIGPIIFLTWIKPQDKVIKSLIITSIFLLNWIFIFFLLGFYKDEFSQKQQIKIKEEQSPSTL